MKRILSTIGALLLLTWVSHSQTIERYVKAVETLETGVSFIYRSVDIPVLDISYHEWSDDSVTWRKNYVAGDCYIRFSNDVKTTWAGYNVCTGSGTGTSQIDTILWTVDGVTDTIVSGSASIYITNPDTVSGTSTNFQDTETHTHELFIELNDNEDVNASPTNGQVIKWNSTTEKWEAANDLIGGGASGYLTVAEQDGSPSVVNVTEIKVDNSRLIDEGSGVVSIDFSLDAVNGEQDFFRTDTVNVSAGDTFLTFSSPLPEADYVVANAYALYSNGERQNLSYDSTTVNGFRVLSVLGTSQVHYLVMRNLDSLGLAVTNQGMVLASGSDPTLGYLSSKVDDNTIGIVNNELAYIADTVTVDEVQTSSLVLNGDTLRATTQIDAIDTISATKNWVLSVAGAGNGWDSLVYQPSNGYIVWWYAGSRVDSTSIDGRYLKIADSTQYVTPQALADTINNTNGLKTMVYSISLPSAVDLTTRIAGAVIYPIGTSWTLTASGGVNLDIEHNLGRRVASVSVFAVTGTQEQQLFNTAALNGVITDDANNARIQSLATSFASKDLRIYIVFE